MMINEQDIGGVELAYVVVCMRKLWLYKKGIGLEDESDRVMQGKILHDTSYPYLNRKEVLIDNTFKIDAIEGEYVREIKLSSRMKQSDEMQMLFYLYQLHLRGINKTGLISYTKEKKTIDIHLTDNAIKKVKQAITKVYEILKLDTPPVVKKIPYCKSCAYYGFCFVGEEDEDVT